MFQSKTVPYETVASDVVRKLLTPLQAIFPDVVQAAFQALSGGRTPENAGQALQAGLQAWMEKERKEKLTEVESLNQTISALRDSMEEKRKEINALKDQIEKMERVVKDVKDENNKLIYKWELQTKTVREIHEHLDHLKSFTQSD